MDLKERINRNPVIYVLGVCVTVAGVVAGIGEHFYRHQLSLVRQRAEVDIARLQSEMASLRRGVGDSKFLDVRSFVIPKSEQSNLRVDPGSTYLPNEEIYILTRLPGWSYQKITVREFAQRESGMQLSPAYSKLVGDLPIHVWSLTAPSSVQGSENNILTGAQIVLQKTPIETAVKRAGEQLPNIVRELAGEEISPPSQNDLEEMDRIFRGDSTGLVLAHDLATYFGDSMDSAGATSEIVALQKVGNVVYLQLVTKYPESVVANKRQAGYFVRHEKMLVSDHDAITVISLYVPSSDPAPRGPVYAQIQKWFSELRILVR